MFGKKNVSVENNNDKPSTGDVTVVPNTKTDNILENNVISDLKHDQRRYKNKQNVISILFNIIDTAELAAIDNNEAQKRITDAVREIVSTERIVMSGAEQQQLISDICDDILGFGALQPLLARDDIADIMVNGPDNVFIEVKGKVQKTPIKFRDDQELLNICQRIVSQVGRRVDEASPICDARLADGSRVNIIAPPLAIDGTTLTIRKFRKEALTMSKLVEYGTISSAGAEIIEVIGATRCNVIVSGGTGSGKTTLLNCLGCYINPSERIVTCEDAAELQLQQEHVVRLETRPTSAENKGEVTMRDLVRNSLRMRPDRIVVGEVRGAEIIDLLQAMNTGHAGSMGTIHSNSPRECLNRIETLMAIGGYQLQQKTIREMICGAVDIIIQVSRLQDGSRKITHVTEIMGLEGDVIVMQDLLTYEMAGYDEAGRIVGRHIGAGLSRPGFYSKAVEFGLQDKLINAFNEL
ncbi:CpaF family protein [Brucella gallinifaecis]|uniref:CpaF family protein n=1 Tax=Brucella gallinifaecis TaxID=215590 RepID=A0A502BNK6_9HYPH|nr:CpaF family protein [Brucella gallinifaecis]TPF75450.1 CpaF family protein [Brucella gallinifaecis]